MTTTTYYTYTLTPKGGYKTTYSGADRAQAEKAYNKLAGKPRLLNQGSENFQTTISHEGMSV